MFGRWTAQTLVAGLVLAALTTTAGAAERPNFVVIVVDDLGWGDLGCAGSPFYKTPNIDRLAADGVRFTDGYASCPVCSPSRASLVSGQYPARLHLTDWLPGRPDRPDQRLKRPAFRQELPLETVTVAELLRDAGYATAAIGKWHLGGGRFGPEAQGFKLNVGGFEAGSPTGGYFGFRSPTLTLPADHSEYLTDRLTDEAVRFLREQEDRPFFLYLAHYAVHIPLQAREELIAGYRTHSPKDGKHTNAIYAAMIQSVDESVGRIRETLTEMGVSQRTLVVFTSDNGGLSVKEGPNTPATSNAPLRAGKGYLYEGGIRVPWIALGVGIVGAGRVSDVPISSIDLVPTLLDLAGVAIPPQMPIDGVSLRPLLADSGRLRREALFWHYPHYSNQGGKPGGAVRSGDFKLIEHYEDGRVELFNLRQDPGEATDISARQPERAATLAGRLRDWRRSVDAQMPAPNPGFRRTD